MGKAYPSAEGNPYDAGQRTDAVGVMADRRPAFHSAGHDRDGGQNGIADPAVISMATNATIFKEF